MIDNRELDIYMKYKKGFSIILSVRLYIPQSIRNNMV